MNSESVPWVDGIRTLFIVSSWVGLFVRLHYHCGRCMGLVGGVRADFRELTPTYRNNRMWSNYYAFVGNSLKFAKCWAIVHFFLWYGWPNYLDDHWASGHSLFILCDTFHLISFLVNWLGRGLVMDDHMDKTSLIQLTIKNNTQRNKNLHQDLSSFQFSTFFLLFLFLLCQFEFIAFVKSMFTLHYI